MQCSAVQCSAVQCSVIQQEVDVEVRGERVGRVCQQWSLLRPEFLVEDQVGAGLRLLLCSVNDHHESNCVLSPIRNIILPI